MLALTSLLSLVLAGALVDARPIPHTVRLYRRAEIDRRGGKKVINYATDRAAPQEWALEHNEPYKSYHFRYLQIGCHKMHDTSFFDRCCHPRISYQTDDDFQYDCSLAAHVTGIAPKKLNKQIKAANAQASNQRHVEIASISSVSVASKESIKSKHSAHVASISSASAAAVESKQAAKAAKQSEKAAKQAEKTAEKTSEVPQPTTTKDKQPPTKPTPTTSSEQPEQTQDSGSNGGHGGNGGSSGGSSGGGQQYGADFGTPSTATWYLQAGTIGACGLQSSPVSDQSKVAAMRYDFYDASKCGQNIKVTNTDNGKSVIAMFNDMCMGCETATSIDLSPGAFEEIGDFATGTLNINWEWV